MSEQSEIDAHPLEVRHAKLKIRQYKDKENASIGGNVAAANGAGGASMMGAFGSSGRNRFSLQFWSFFDPVRFQQA